MDDFSQALDTSSLSKPETLVAKPLFALRQTDSAVCHEPFSDRPSDRETMLIERLTSDAAKALLGDPELIPGLSKMYGVSLAALAMKAQLDIEIVETIRGLGVQPRGGHKRSLPATKGAEVAVLGDRIERLLSDDVLALESRIAWAAQLLIRAPKNRIKDSIIEVTQRRDAFLGLRCDVLACAFNLLSHDSPVRVEIVCAYANWNEIASRDRAAQLVAVVEESKLEWPVRLAAMVGFLSLSDMPEEQRGEKARQWLDKHKLSYLSGDEGTIVSAIVQSSINPQIVSQILLKTLCESDGFDNPRLELLRGYGALDGVSLSQRLRELDKDMPRFSTKLRVACVEMVAKLRPENRTELDCRAISNWFDRCWKREENSLVSWTLAYEVAHSAVMSVADRTDLLLSWLGRADNTDNDLWRVGCAVLGSTCRETPALREQTFVRLRDALQPFANSASLTRDLDSHQGTIIWQSSSNKAPLRPYVVPLDVVSRDVV